MYKHYYYNKNLDEHGYHEVHTEDCANKPKVENQVYIGYFKDCHAAIDRAKAETGKSNFDGCKHCCRPCHNL